MNSATTSHRFVAEGLAYVGNAIRPRASADDRILAIATMIIVGALLLGVAAPLYALLAKGFQSADGRFIGLANYKTYFSTPALFDSIGNSVAVTLIATAIAVPLAFLFAYGLTRTCMPAKSLFKGIALIPILGGIGTLFGPVLGAAILIPISEFSRIHLSGSGRNVDLIVYGGLIMLVSAWRPMGLLGHARREEPGGQRV
jgi:ABC-type spermidine/putrescine transport system permease subunit II